ncbi:FtsX-like permease family protein [Sphingomonas sp.]|uniref:FtsX-like permease family protein n=1 Tax=Sphingomonas sp. TaxID=28214 RepID=UPI00325FCBC0
MNWLFASAPDRRLIPGGGFRGATPWVIMIMVFLIVTVSAAGLSLKNVAGIVSAGVSQRYSVQLADGAARLPAVVAAARSAAGVASARPVPETEMRATLERWLGPAAAAGGDLPLPAMVDVELRPDADPAVIGRRIETAVPGARFVAHADSLRPLLSGLHAVALLAAGLVLLVVLASAAVVVLAARSALDTNRTTIEILHGVGATDRQVAGLFQRRIALDALAGGVAGGVAAALVLFAILGGATGMVAELAGGPLLHRSDLVALALLPLAVALLATLVARAAVLAALRASL